MPSRTGRERSVHRRAVLVVVLLAAFLGGSVALATGALAHDDLVTTSPTAGATVANVPAEVVLTFAEPPLPLGLAVQVLDPDGVDQSAGPPAVAGRTVSQAIRSGAPAGAYTVSWRVTAADGHPTTASFTFSASRPGGSTTSASTERPVSAGLRSASSGLWFVTVAVAVALLGATALVGARRRRELTDRDGRGSRS